MSDLRIAICDPGLWGRWSHNFNNDLALSRTLRRRGCDVQIYGCRDADPYVLASTGAHAVFERQMYGRVDEPPGFDEELNWRVMNASIENDLTQLGEALLGRDRVVLVPNVTQHQLHGLASWYANVADHQRPVLIISLMFFPSWTAWGDTAIRGPEFYLRAIDILRPWIGSSVVLVTENVDIASYLSDLLNAPVEVAPVPLETPARLDPVSANRPLRFGFLGYGKTEKGFHLLPKAMEICRSRGAKFQLVAHIHHWPVEPEIIAADKAFETAKQVDVVRGAIVKPFYYALIDSCDAILLPYDPFQYRTRGSGVLSEAVTYAKPVVATSDTWAAAAALRGECAAILCEFDSASLAEAMLRLADTMPAMQALALEKAGSWLAANNVEVYCDMIERHGGVTHERPTPPEPAPPSLSDAFPLWPTAAPGALPAPGAVYSEAQAGLAWDAAGSATMEGDEAHVTFLSPTEGKLGALELHCAIAGDAVYQPSVNGVVFKTFEGARQQVVRLPVASVCSVTAGLASMLKLKRVRGHGTLTITAVRAEAEPASGWSSLLARAGL